MIRTRRRKRVVPRDNLEDGSSQSRSQFMSSNSLQRNLVHNGPQQIQGRKNCRNNVISFFDSQFQPNNLQENYSTGDTSSESEGEEFFHFSRLRLRRHHSDYETGESSDRPTRADMTKRNQHKHNPTTSQVIDPDSSSDDSVLSPRIVKNLKRPISPTTTSDASDSGIPIISRKPVKRMRVFSSSEGSSSGCSSGANDQNPRPDENNESGDNINNTEKVNPAESELATNSTQENGGSPIVISGPSVQISRGRSIPVIDSESESDLVTNHTVRGRRIPVIESEDDSGSLVEHRRSPRASSVQSVAQRVNSVLGIHGIRRRRRNALPPQESERGPTINIADSFLSTHNVRRRQVVDSNIINPATVGQNVWRVVAQAEETEDDGVPILNRRRVRGRRIPVVESEENSESDSANNNEIPIPEGGNEVVSSLGSDVVNLRRRRNIPLIESEDDSNSDSDIRPRTLSNRMVPIFQSDDSSSTSSSSSTDSDDSIPIRNPRRRNRPIPIVDDYEDIANNFNEFDVNIKVSTVVKVFAEHDGQNGNSSDTDGESEKCPICLTGFKLQEIGKPKSCDHKFCSSCIKEWATKNNTCPVDRKVFNGIVVYDKIEGKIICEQPIEKPNQNFLEAAFGGIEDIEEIVAELFTDSSESSWYFDDSDEGPEEICFVCRSSNRPHRMISCDSCNNVYHLECVIPPLRDFPTINWYCPNCDYETDIFSADSD